MKKKFFLIFNHEKFLASSDGRIQFFKEEELHSINPSLYDTLFFLAEDDTHYLMLISRSSDTQIDHQALLKQPPVNLEWLSLRTQLGLLAEPDFQRVGRALQVYRWQEEHKFCGRCGARTIEHPRDFAKQCRKCELDFYPRISPCIMVLVVRGDKMLLAKHARSKSDRYSCLAGFIEAGETPEQTLVREVMEEVSVKVHNLRYFASQPWPFPGQLMIGFIADYLEGDIQVDGEEILDAGWFDADHLPQLPPVDTLSGKMISYFLSRHAL